VLVENEDGTRTRISPTDPIQRGSVAKRLLTPGDTCDISKGIKIVCIQKQKQTNKQTPWPLVRERTIPTDRPPLVDEI
jgi:hypothetical protein